VRRATRVLLHIGVAAAALASCPVVLASTTKSSRPNVAEYTVAISIRDLLARNARMTLGAITRCERRAGDPFGADLDTLNGCVRTPLARAVGASRVVPVFLAGVTRDLGPGRCLILVGSLLNAGSEVEDAASTWIADSEIPSASQGKLEREDALEMRRIDRGVLRLRRRRWRSFCRPRK
jgi:hypothetical protein